MSVIKEKKSNLDARWNHRGDKFCVGSSSGYVYQATYNPDFGFWVAAEEKKPRHKDSCICVRYDPGSSRVCASTSLDGTVKIVSCFDKHLDKKDTAATGPFAGVTTSDKTIYKFDVGCWVNFFSFSGTGNSFAFASHDTEVHFVTVDPNVFGAKDQTTNAVACKGPPLLKGIFLNDDNFLSGGYGKVPLLFKKDGAAWALKGSMDAGIGKEKKSAIGGNAFSANQCMFEGANTENVKLKPTDTKHQNFINDMTPYVSSANKVMAVATSDPNGYIHVWDVSSV